MKVISISGNSGVGKSALLMGLEKGLKTIGLKDVWRIDESNFHHQFLELMFANPGKWAFPIQLNFLLQRSTYLMMERSIEEDHLYCEYYRNGGSFSKPLYACYETMHDYFAGEIGGPDIFIYLKADPKLLVKRIEDDMASGKRAREVEGKQLKSYIDDLNEIYAAWSEAKRQGGNGYLWIEPEVSGDANRIVDQILPRIESAIR